MTVKRLSFSIPLLQLTLPSCYKAEDLWFLHFPPCFMLLHSCKQALLMSHWMPHFSSLLWQSNQYSIRKLPQMVVLGMNLSADQCLSLSLSINIYIFFNCVMHQTLWTHPGKCPRVDNMVNMNDAWFITIFRHLCLL